MEIGNKVTNLDWTPHGIPVELILNGAHRGQYLLTEQVRVDKDRVNVTEMTTSDNEGDAVTGGYLLELDFHWDNAIQWKDHEIPFAVKYPDEDDITQAQVDYIKGYIAEASNALYGNDFRDPEKGYAAYIDVDSFVDYWIVYEVLGYHELAIPGSVYFHKDRGGKIVAGPLWDFDFGVLSYKTSPQAKTGLVLAGAIWYARLFEDKAFRQKVIDRLEEMMPQLREMPVFMQETEDFLQKSAIVNFSKWNPADDGIINGDEALSYGAACERLRTIFNERLEVVPAALEKLYE
jgi:hypothetical protein